MRKEDEVSDPRVDMIHEMLCGPDNPADGERWEIYIAKKIVNQIDMGQWQPIETAPKDGTNVLLVNWKGNIASGMWMSGIMGTGWFLRGGNEPNVFFNDHHGPTHWMPLPAPPEPK